MWISLLSYTQYQDQRKNLTPVHKCLGKRILFKFTIFSICTSMPMMPRTTAGITAITFTATKSLGMNLGLKRPKSPLYLNPWKAELRRSVVKVATIQQKKTCQESLFFQKDETSSMAKSKPPTGAPNAEAIPEERDQRGVCLQACDWSIFSDWSKLT